MPWLLPNFRAITRHNLHTLRRTPLAELSGAVGDLGTLLPLLLAQAIGGGIDVGATLVFAGAANVATGLAFGVPLPVQPMKAIAAVAIARKFNMEETTAAGVSVSAAVLVLALTGLLAWLARAVPVPVVKGIQVGAGLSLAISAGTAAILPLDWVHPGWDNRVIAIAAFFVLAAIAAYPRVPYALGVFVVGMVIAGVVGGHGDGPGDVHGVKGAGIWHPRTVVPSGDAWRIGAVEAAIPQLPLTTLNSILAVTSLSASLFPSFPPPPSTTALGISVAVTNLVGCWFGAMPVCHGSGGLAGQYRFGARSGSSVVILGLVKVILGLFVGPAVLPLLQRFPKSLLGIMVFAAGVELAKVGQSVGEIPDLWDQAYEESTDRRPPSQSRRSREQESRDRWMVMLITAAGCLAFKNDAVGFLAGLLWHWCLRVPGVVGRMVDRSGMFRHERERDEQSEGLLDANHDAPEGRIV